MPEDFTFSPGDICFAKVKGFPHWPARINRLPPDVKIPKGKYPIFFYGTHEVCFLPKNAIFPYEENKEKLGGNRNSQGFNKGMSEMENNRSILEFGMDPKALNYYSKFYNFSTPKARTFIKKLKSENNIKSEPKVSTPPSASSSTPTVSHKSSRASSNSTSIPSSDIPICKIALHTNSEGYSEHDTESKSSLEPSITTTTTTTSTTTNPIVFPKALDAELLPTIIKDRGPTVMVKYDMFNIKVEPDVYMEPIHNVHDVENNKVNNDNDEKYKDEENCLDPEPITKEESLLNETLSTICMADLSSDDQMDEENVPNSENKDKNTDYLHDFGNLLLEIKKITWSPSRKYELQRKLRRNKFDSRVRIFFPWFQIPK